MKSDRELINTFSYLKVFNLEGHKAEGSKLKARLGILSGLFSFLLYTFNFVLL